MASGTSRPELLVIVGETASGKSALAHKLARDFNGEIIAADSWAVYRGFDIGTSKPTKGEQQKIKYHLLDVVEAPQGFNAPQFKRLAESAIKDVQGRKKLPIMVGGTGLYIDSVLFDFGFLPNVTPKERSQLNALTTQELIEKARKLGIDLSGIDIRNKRRIIRAIEAKGEKPTRGNMKAGALIVGLQTGRDEQRERVERRTEHMLAAGLQQEVNALAAKYGWGVEPMKGIGYREWRLYFQGCQSLEQTKQRIVSSTMNLAKKQRTWFKRNPHIQWFSSGSEAYDFAFNSLNK